MKTRFPYQKRIDYDAYWNTYMEREDAIRRLKGLTCGSKHTSCPDQIALALEEALAK